MDRALQWIALALLPLAAPAWALTPDEIRSVTEKPVHHYVYYPAHRIYNEPDRHTWFWYQGGQWWTDHELPPVFQPLAHDGVYVDLRTARPYERQAWVESRFGSPAAYERRHPGQHPHDNAPRARDPYPMVTARAKGLVGDARGLRA